MPEPIKLEKLLDITPTAMVKSASSTIKGILVILAVAGFGWAVYAGIIRPTTKPNPTTKQEAQQIVNYNYEPKMMFGCVNWKIPKNENPVSTGVKRN